MERSKSLVLKEFWGGELEFYIAIYRASQIKGWEFFFGDTSHTTDRIHAAERIGIERREHERECIVLKYSLW